MIANYESDQRLATKAGASDLVQETLLAAQENLDQFRGTTQAELLAWLRQILLNHRATLQRQYLQAAKRAAGRELSLERLVQVAGETIAARDPSPSSYAIRREEAERLHEALAQVPDRYRQVIELRHQDHLPFEEVAQAMDLTVAAARQLWARAISRLKKELRNLGMAQAP